LGAECELDVRPAEEYAAGHIPDAVNVPLCELDNYLKKLKPEQEIVALLSGTSLCAGF
jgi:rhodanese-related sulfurtransferase